MAERRDGQGRCGGDVAEPGPRHTERTRADKAARQSRLAAEMRKNLQKRKRQQRARDGDPPQD
jgi:hypothetical protein